MERSKLNSKGLLYKPKLEIRFFKSSGIISEGILMFHNNQLH